jgi:hypothetical protein
VHAAKKKKKKKKSGNSKPSVTTLPWLLFSGMTVLSSTRRKLTENILWQQTAIRLAEVRNE